ncbi:hypothetical protein [Streptomyces sp. SID161]|uniref:hypothetical protein n=1 Tax=Streptomyces sp. SID161 TaxID=2690251 RepID=UPI00136FD1C2|nr:hypothetical protein [Streptomyces sp. SID161]MYW49635.1 hypothetical protein [Streptomyces sp. SID161]
MTKLQTLLLRKNETAANWQQGARETGPRGYRDPQARPVILANRIYKRRFHNA